MNRRTKIIVGVAGIFIVLLALLGLTYAYFLTKINGNTNAKSISVTTANLKLDYGDGTGAITTNNIMPGTALDSKTFTVTNSGNVTTDYIVVLEDIIDTFTRQKDFKYSLTCTSSSGTCNGVNERYLLTPDDTVAMVVNSIAKNVTHTYTLSIKYEEVGEDQSIDMGKTLSAKVNIRSLDIGKPDTLQYAIINNAKNKRNGTELLALPKTLPAEEMSGIDEKTLSIAPDDYGLSYYYRGSVENNYLEFNNMCFRIVRIEGDGSIKITLAKEGTCSSIADTDMRSSLINNANEVIYGQSFDGSSYKFCFDCVENGAYSALDTWYSNKMISKEKYLKQDKWCLGTLDYRYSDSTGELLTSWPSSYLYQPARRTTGFGSTWDNMYSSYVCPSNNHSFNYYIGLLTADEAAYAGATGSHSNKTFYLKDNANSIYWTLSYGYNDNGNDNAIYLHDSGGTLGFYYMPDYTAAVRPTITLTKGVVLKSGNGTKIEPYTIVEDV